jgi:hypothetical protein
MRASTTQLKPLASLAAAVLIALLSSVPASTREQPISTCGFTRALRTIKSVETLRKQGAALPGYEYAGAYAAYVV